MPPSVTCPRLKCFFRHTQWLLGGRRAVIGAGRFEKPSVISSRRSCSAHSWPLSVHTATDWILQRTSCRGPLAFWCLFSVVGLTFSCCFLP